MISLTTLFHVHLAHTGALKGKDYQRNFLGFFNECKHALGMLIKAMEYTNRQFSICFIYGYDVTYLCESLFQFTNRIRIQIQALNMSY